MGHQVVHAVRWVFYILMMDKDQGVPLMLQLTLWEYRLRTRGLTLHYAASLKESHSVALRTDKTFTAPNNVIGLKWPEGNAEKCGGSRCTASIRPAETQQNLWPFMRWDPFQHRNTQQQNINIVNDSTGTFRKYASTKKGDVWTGAGLCARSCVTGMPLLF